MSNHWQRILYEVVLSMKMGVLMAVKGKLTASARKRPLFSGRKGGKQKRDTLERMSHIFGVELGGTVEKPWPPVAS